MKLKSFWITLVLGAIYSPLASAGIAFSFSDITPGGMIPQALLGFQTAADQWSSVLNDNITVNLDIGFTALGPTTLGSASSSTVTLSYSNFTSALAADATSSDDFTASAALQMGSTFNLLINRTSNNPNGSGSATPYLDNDGDTNNSTIWMTTANAKALGFSVAGTDASISFNNAFSWDFDQSDGITPGAYDFTGVAAHEIGHALGFISGVDILDILSPPVGGPLSDEQFTFVSPLDMFRFSADSVSQGAGVIDWTADTRSKYFSIDGGTTAIAQFSTGRNFGDGWQASHWKNLSGLLMDPAVSVGVLKSITAQDIQALDVIGYDIVPEPENVSVFMIGFFLMAFASRKRSERRRLRTMEMQER